MSALERDALEVLGLVRSLKNTFAPINKIPSEVFSLIPDYHSKDDTDDSLITLTHVCRGWRNIFISRPSLWTRFDFRNVDKTRTYVQRSKSFPLNIYLEDNDDDATFRDAFSLVVPHLHRLKSLTILANNLSDTLQNFYSPAPLLKELVIDIGSNDRIPGGALFNGDLSSLRKLRLCGITTNLPWRNLANLQIFEIRPGHHHKITQLLDFFEAAPILHTIELSFSIPTSSDAPPGRIVPLPRLNSLRIIAGAPHSILLNHLHVPTGSSLFQRFQFGGEKSPLLDYLLKSSTNLRNLSHITTANLRFDSITKYIRLRGPNGSLYMLADRTGNETLPSTMDHRILRSLHPLILPTTEILSVSKYSHSSLAEIPKCPIFQTLSSMDNLRTLTLIKCNNLPFVLSLNPERNPSGLLSCPNLEEITLYIKSRDQYHTKHLISMAKNRASRNKKLLSITIVGLGKLAPGKEVLKLREHVTHVEYRVENVSPAWDDPPERAVAKTSKGGK